MPRSPLTIAVSCTIAALIGLMAYGVLQAKPDQSIDSAVFAGQRKLAPVRSIPQLGNPKGTISLKDYRGKIVVLNFWASWCTECRAESPALERAHRRYGKRGVVVLGADVDDLASDARKFINQFKLTYPMVRYSSNNAAKDFGTKALPETFVIDRSGKIVTLRRGPVDDEWLNKTLKPLLEESK